MAPSAPTGADLSVASISSIAVNTQSATPSQSYTPSTSAEVTSTTSQAATLASASPTPSQSLAVSPKHGISTGDLAGAVVAAAVGGALFAFVVTFLLMRSKGRKLTRNSQKFERRRDAKGPNLTVKEIPEDSLPIQDRWEKHLPQSADDNSVRLNVKTFLHQVELHVETFYITPNPPVKITEDLEVQLLKIDSPNLPESVVSMLPKVQDQTLLIKHCLAQMIISRISAEGADTKSFLPPDYTSLPQAMQTARGNSRKPGFNQALSRWRVLTSYLRPTITEDQSYISIRDANIHDAADIFCTSFALWANTRYTSVARYQHLTQIMKAATDTGILVFSQPATFAYLWNVPAGARRSGVSFVVTPAFAKVTDEKAKALEKPYIMVPHVLQGL